MKALVLYFFMLMLYPGKRQVLIFYNENGIDLKERQLAELKKDATGLANRDMAIQVYAVDTAQTEAKKWHINPAKPFTVLLIGKDGGEKLRSDTALTVTNFFDTIDAMPMRKREIRDNE